MAIILEHEKAPASKAAGVDKLTRKELREILEDHGMWLDSLGDAGIRADLSGKNLESADLVDARLPDAHLHKTNLKGADLTLADLRGAGLVQANLAEASLLGTQLQQASLQAADLHGATGLLSPQLAGANLFGAILPDSISPGDGLKLVRKKAEKAGWLMGLTLLLEGLVWLRIFTTPDSQLVKNSSALPFSSLQSTLPFIPFYLFGPVVILSLYLCFHLYMQRLWDGIAQLPAIFPDGRKLDACLPWFARWTARLHFKWLRKSHSPLAFLEAAIAILVLYWAAPITVLLFWGRYLTLEDLRGTTLHIFLVAGAVTAAMNFPRMAGKAFGPDTARPSAKQIASNRRTHLILRSVPPVFGLLLFLLSIGTFLGVPHDYRATAQSVAPGVRAWAPDILWTFGYNPFAQLTEADVSTKPRGWTGGEDEIASVRGANLNRLRLRYIQAYGAFLVKAHLWQTDLRNAYLSEADLREANLRQVDLRFAVLDRAKLGHAALPEADLRNANLTLANLVESYLISTNMSNAHLKNADLSKAILTDANLRKADLSGAVLQGAVLRGTDLAGANLQGADLRGAEGLTPTQICSATNLRGAQIDENLQLDVTNLCGNAH